MIAKQLLLLPKPKNYRLLFLNGRPAGMYSLRRFCFEAVRDDPGCLSYYNYEEYKINKKISYMTFGQAVREKIYLQKHLIQMYRTVFTKQRGAWQKQREHYKKLLRDIRDGEPLEQYFE